MTNLQKYSISKKWKRWLLWLPLSLAVLFSLLILYWKYRKKNKELTGLRTEAEIKRTQLAHLQHKLDTEEDKVVLERLKTEFNETAHAVDLIQRTIVKTEADAQAALKQIEALKTWDDLDKYNRSGR
jgi:acyl-CoA synthetase (NDP forming)